MGDLSKNFDSSEFRCSHCKRLDLLDPKLIRVLQRIRDAIGKPLPIVSGYRCWIHNKAVGGYAYSQHMFGRAADIPRGLVRAQQVAAAGGHGAGIRAGWVIHVDLTPGRSFFTFDE